MIRGIYTTHMTIRTILPAAVLSLAVALPARAQLGSPVDPGLGYVGPFGPASSRGIPRLAQTFQPAPGADWLQSFTFFLGDFNPGASGTGLVFRAAVYAVNGAQLGSQLFLSGPQSGSANFTTFDAYTFATSNLFLDPLGTFALVLESVSSQDQALNAVAAGASDYDGGAFYIVNDDGAFSPAIDGRSDAAFNATLTASVVPEPATVVLLASGLLFVGVVACRRRGVHAIS
jgi:hypothetical protein